MTHGLDENLNLERFLAAPDSTSLTAINFMNSDGSDAANVLIIFEELKGSSTILLSKSIKAYYSQMLHSPYPWSWGNISEIVESDIRRDLDDGQTQSHQAFEAPFLTSVLSGSKCDCIYAAFFNNYSSLLAIRIQSNGTAQFYEGE